MEMENEQQISFTIPKMRGEHRRAQIINALADMFSLLVPSNEIHQLPEAETDLLPGFFPFPIAIKTVQKRFVHWSALDQQNALPALLLTYGDGGDAPDSEVVGYVDENFPIACTAVMKEEIGQDSRKTMLTDLAAQALMRNDEMAARQNLIDAAFERNKEKELTDQASDIHYSVGQLLNSNPTLGVEGINPEKTRIRNWRGSEGAITKFEIIRFRVVVVHRYHASESV